MNGIISVSYTHLDVYKRQIYKRIGLLSKGHFVEVSRTDLIAGYQGQTALKVKKVIEKAKGGVLFIDEAYSITENEHSDSYGRECLTELTKALEDYREDLVVIVADVYKRQTYDMEKGISAVSQYDRPDGASASDRATAWTSNTVSYTHLE